MSVDLPAPFSPTSAWISPARTSKETPFSARTPGKLFSMPLTDSSTLPDPSAILLLEDGSQFVIRQRRIDKHAVRQIRPNVFFVVRGGDERRRQDLLFRDLFALEQAYGSAKRENALPRRL